MDISYHMYQQGPDVLLAACDKELLGRTLEDGNIHLEVKEGFYGGKKIDEEGLSSIFTETTIANLVGEKTVQTAIEEGFGSEEDVLLIEDVPHLQVVRA